MCVCRNSAACSSYRMRRAAWVVARLVGMIESQGLTKDYGDKRAVDDLSFRVRAGHRDGLPRAERLREVDDDAADPRARRPDARAM